MRNLFLSLALIVIPVGIFAVGYTLLAPSQAPAQAAASANTGPALGDMQPFISIISDVQGIANKGDMVAAEKRITDFETAWDDAQKKLRPVNTTSWGNVDDAADSALGALRDKSPDPAKVKSTLADLMAELKDPKRVPGGAQSAAGVTTTSAGIAVTDANGRPLPCEEMLQKVRDGLAKANLAKDKQGAVEALQAKAVERCNADDDKRSDDFSAQALALLPN